MILVQGEDVLDRMEHVHPSNPASIAEAADQSVRAAATRQDGRRASCRSQALRGVPTSSVATAPSPKSSCRHYSSAAKMTQASQYRPV